MDQYKRGGNMKADAALLFWVAVFFGFFAVGLSSNASSMASATIAVPNPAPVASPTPSSAGAGNQVPASSSVKVTEAPPKPSAMANATAAVPNPSPVACPVPSSVLASCSVKVTKPTVVVMEIKITKIWFSDYNKKSSTLFKNLLRDLYAVLNSTLFSHGLFNVTILSVKAGSIIVEAKLYFLVPSGSSSNIEEVIKNDKDGKLKSFGVDLKSLAITFPGVTLGAWKPKSNECATKCCDGAGGSLDLERTCTPSASCGGISVTKKSENSCTSYCDNTDCNSGTLAKSSISTFILAALALIRTLA